MTDPGELSPGTSPSQPSTSSPTPSSTPSAPTFEQRRAQSRSAATPRERGPSAPNPRASRPDHWSDRGTGEGRARAAAAARRGETSEPPSTSATPAPGAAPGEQQQPTGQSDIGPVERTADGKYKFGDVSLSDVEIKGLIERHAVEQSRKATLPADPSGYKLELPEDFTIPPGVELVLTENEQARLAREFALEAGLSQSQFARLVGIAASRQVAETARLNAAMAAETKKLGQTGTLRVSAVQQFLRGTLGDEMAQPFIATMVTERMVKGWETLIERVTNQGAGSFSSAHREPPASNGRIEGFEHMSFEQRRAAQNALLRRR
jgi:hypothetical protein